MGEFHAHVPQAAQADDAHFLSRPHLPMAQRGIGGAAGAQQRGDGLQVQRVRYFDHEVFAHDDTVRIAAEGQLVVAAFVVVVGQRGAFFAVLLQVQAAGLAVQAGIHHAAHAGVVARLELGDVLAHLGDAADDFVAGHHRIDGVAPIAARLMQIGMADAAVEDVDQHIVVAGFAPGETERNERGIGAVGGVASGLDHDGLE
ncbi:hypothetical protein G6F65_015042 [Rhizopus arrhizus]|nr:hypothetical protein G6F65_015042 [Rhizopus arrhizus]